MEIVEKIARERGEILAKTIDDYALKVFKVPNWVRKWRWFLKIYAKLYRLEIRRFEEELTDDIHLEFWTKKKKVGELKINYHNKII